MARPRKPYFRASDGWWVSRFRGEYVKLAKGEENEAAALKRFHELMALEAIGTPAASADVTVAALFEAFLDWSSRNNEKTTYEWYKLFLQSFVDRYATERVQDLKPYHVTRWLDAEAGWGEASRRCAVTAVKRALNWATDEGYIPANPLKKVRKPPAKRREKILTADERKVVAAGATDKVFKVFHFALQQTGCRPGEIARVTADMVDLDKGTWTFTKHKTFKKTGKPRVVYLTPPMVKLCRLLIKEHPTGPIFRNRRGNAWNRNSVRCRFRRLRKKHGLDKGIVAYAYRHTYATDGLAAGVPATTMAELLGHKDTQMITENYGHLDQKSAHLRDAAERAARPREDA